MKIKKQEKIAKTKKTAAKKPKIKIGKIKVEKKEKVKQKQKIQDTRYKIQDTRKKEVEEKTEEKIAEISKKEAKIKSSTTTSPTIQTIPTTPTKQESSYEAKDIYVLEGLEPVRRRPGMYIGSTGPDGLHHLIWEVADNCLDEFMSGYGNTMNVELLPNDKARIGDNGRGIPVDIHKQTKKSALETVMCTLHAGGKFGGDSYKIAGGLHGVGVSVVNALSKWLKVEVCREGVVYAQEYNRGKPLYKVKKVGTCFKEKTGTTVTFESDPEVFKEIKFDLKKIIDHLREQAYLTSKVRINIVDRRGPIEKNYGFYFEGGLRSFLKYLIDDEPTIGEPFIVSKEHEDVLVEIALVYTEDIQPKEFCFANNIHTHEGGMHLTGFRSSLTRALNDYGWKNGYLKEGDDNFLGDDVREGLTAIISVKIKNPQFEGQTKAKLGNPEARTAVETVMLSSFSEFLEKNSQDARRIIEKCLLAMKARKAAKAAKETVLRKGLLEGLALPGKLADCTSRQPEESELFIVEGDSAGGSGKQGRDRKFQAILPLRGKILNVEKARLDKMLENKEIKALIIALGTAIAEEFNIEKIRYHKVIITTDADVDGAHIKTLLLTLFFRYFPQIIDKGYLYIANPPLYRVQCGKEIKYAYSDSEKEKVVGEFQKIKTEKLKIKMTSNKLLRNLTGQAIQDSKREDKEKEGVAEEEAAATKGVIIQRYKGLGEMNPEQLWETTMDPARRILKQVQIKDAEEADNLFNILMGEEVSQRKRFIQAYAKEVRNLDI